MLDLFFFSFMVNMVLVQMVNIIVIFDCVLVQFGDEQRYFIIQYFYEVVFDGVMNFVFGFVCCFQCVGFFIEEMVFIIFCSDGNVVCIQRRYNWCVVFQYLKFIICVRYFN